jgi:hypothetical protein
VWCEVLLVPRLPARPSAVKNELVACDGGHGKMLRARMLII